MANEADLDALEAMLSSRTDADTRYVAGRSFTLRDGIWIDRAHVDSAKVVEIEPYGAAYFALLKHAPELERWFTAFESLVVSGSDVSIKVAPGGASELTGREVSRVVREFRGH